MKSPNDIGECDVCVVASSNPTESPKPTATEPRAEKVSSGMDLQELESETLNILQRYGSPGAKSARRIGAPVSVPSKREGKSARPWTGAAGVRRPLHTTGGIIVKPPNKSSADPRPFTSLSKKQPDASGYRDDDRKLFKADGTARNALRNTISSALSTSQFDSVPSLLASGRHAEESSPIDQDRQPAVRRSSPFLRDPSPYMVSVMGVNKARPKTTMPVGTDGSSEDKFDPSKLKSLSLRDIKYTGFDRDSDIDASRGDGENRPVEARETAPVLEKEVCFNCWSAGEGIKCVIHTDTPRSIASDPGNNLSMCKNWNTGFLTRKYRSEGIQERFSQTSQSLVFDRSQKEFSTLELPKHPIYRLLTQHVARMNFTYQRRQHVQIWFRSFVKKLKDGKYEGKRSGASAQILLLRSTVKSMMAVRKLSAEVKDRHPKAPVTGTTMREKLGQEQILVEKLVTVNGTTEKCNFVIAGPTPVPKALYRPRKYEPLPPTTFVLNDGATIETDRLDFSSIISTSRRFATFGRKRANENIAVGGLSSEMIVSQLFTGRFPPQYKNFTCNHDAVLVPPSVDEATPTFPTLEVPPGKLPYIRRELVTPLDDRLPPAVMVKTGLTPEDRHYFGLNRPEQTGEEGDVGFRTSTWCSLPEMDDAIDTNSFRPSQSVATPNSPALSPMRTMKVDGSHPFAKERSRTNRVADLYHLLLSDRSCSSNALQMFTCVGSQQCGYFLQNGDGSLPIGRVVTRVVRSWAFLQSQEEEHVPYEEERTPLGLGGVVLKRRPRHAKSMPTGVLMTNSRKDVRDAILRKMPVEKEPLEDAMAPSLTATRPSDAPKITVTEVSTLAVKESRMDDFSEESPERSAPIYRGVSAQSLRSNAPGIPLPEIKGGQNSMVPMQSAKKDALDADSISQVIGETLKSFSSKPEDLIRLGMGIGASLGAQGFLGLGRADQNGTPVESAPSAGHIAAPLVENLTTAEKPGLDAIDNVTMKSCSSQESRVDPLNNDNFSCSSEETKLDPLIDDGNALNDRKLVNFSDFHPSPQGLLDTIAAKSVGSKRVEYLSYTFSLNLPAPRKIERLKPRPAVMEWKETGYDPWSAGRPPTSSTFVRSLAHETKRWPKATRSDDPKLSDTAKEFKALCTLCRHGKYRELEEMINSPSWTLPIDHCDDSGNTLLMIACQNGNKRIAKLCLRRGSEINNQNLNGNTCLHFSYGYGFSDLGDYLISKGADDSLQNGNGLTCYEFQFGEELDGA
ncbi:hypothetical protein ACHAWF_009708 [Thalassiosira exigua]